MIKFYGKASMNLSIFQKCYCRKHQRILYLVPRYLSSSEVSAALRPFYFLVHPDLFGRYPKAQYVNGVNLKLLNSHLDSLVNNARPLPVHLKFFIKNTYEEGILDTRSVELNKNSAKETVQNILKTFKLPTNYVDNLQDKKHSSQRSKLKWQNDFYHGSHFNQREAFYAPKQADDLFSWLVKNMGEAERRLSVSKPIRKDIERLQKELVQQLCLLGVTWERGIGTTHLRGCLQGLKALATHHPVIKNILRGRHIHFGNETGVSLEGRVILSTSEVRDQWLQLIRRVENLDSKIRRIPHMQKAVSNSLRDIQVTYRKYQPFLLAESYSQNLKRLVTSLGDFLGRSGFPPEWPDSLSHLQLVVESAAGPLMLSPTGQIIAPSSCPPWLLVNFISENMEEAHVNILNYESMKEQEKELHQRCIEELSLSFLDKDDSVSPQFMIDCLSRLIDASYRLSPLLSGSRLWITQYYTVMFDGEVCIPFDWDKNSI